MNRKSRLRIIVSGMIAGVPSQGGATWAVLQYALGLRRLGHDVYVVEPNALESPQLPESASASYFQDVVRRFGLQEHAALVVPDTQHAVCMSYDHIQAVCDDADLLLNISGSLKEENLIRRIRCRVFLDLDPAFTQLWQAVQGIDMGFDAHNRFVTIGTRIGMPGCEVPRCGREWLTSLQPIVLDEWPQATEIVHDAYTTVANWRAYGSIEHQGLLYGQKAHSLRRFMHLPRGAPDAIRLALSIHPDEITDLEAMRSNGWLLDDPARFTSTPDKYQAYVQGSKGEFGIAKSGYVVSRCGWFSDRSICYLASGRPVIAQDTGFGADLPVGRGLFSFDSAAEVLAAMETINSDYALHRVAARELAAEYCNSDRVLGRLLDTLFSTAQAGAHRG